MTTTPLAATLLDDPDFISELKEAAKSANKTDKQASRYAAKCLKEIEATPRTSWLRPAAKLARFVYTRSYEAKLDINLEKLEELRELSKTHLILFLWSHKSHMDSFVFLLSLYENQFRPIPLIFAGVNMNFLGFGALARRVGAIFLRRSFADDPIYKLVFRRYIDFVIRNKMPLSWSIEGTRSRTGKLSPPKLGVLNWVVEACEREQMKDVVIVPVSIAFDRIAEINDYVAMQQGVPKRKESLKWFIDYIFGQRSPHGKVYVRYGNAMPMPVSAIDPSASEGRKRLEVSQLAFEASRRIEQITPIKATDVLAMVLLGANRRALTPSEIARQAAEIVQLIKQKNLPVATGFSLDTQEQVDAAILALTNSGLVKRFDKASTPVFYIPRSQHLAAAYYRNTVTHYFLSAALGEMGLALCTLDIEQPNELTLRKHVKGLRNLYKFEFFYKSSAEFWRDVLDETNTRYPGWQDGGKSLQKHLQNQPPRFGHAILRSFTEAYLVLAVGLLQLGDSPVSDRKAFTKQLLQQGRQMLLRQSISGESSISQDLFANGLRMAEHMQLLERSEEGLAEARQAFADRVLAALSAIDLLQARHDEAWYSPFPDLPGTIKS
ncbi:MAG: 1-acyl-sn-glycerol-3-phosphate acyltransferase [Halioglobus sp.]